MGFDRVGLKLEARGKCRGPVLKVTLVYLLLVSLIPSILSLFYSGPVSSYLNTFEELAASGDIGADTINQMMATYSSSSAMTVAYFCSVLITLLTYIIQFGYYAYTMKVARNQPNEGCRELTGGFRLTGKLVWMCVYTSILIFLWSLLFVIPGIIAAYRYRMAPYILLDNPDISVTGAVRQSKEMTYGHKWELFIFDLSFIGWTILASVVATMGATLGGLIGLELVTVILEFALGCIINVWLTAYQQIAEMNIYNVLSGQRANGSGPDNMGGYQQPWGQSGEDYQPQNDQQRWNANGNEDDPWN